MSTTLERPGSHTDDDNDAEKRARRLMFHPTPRSAESFHMATDERSLALPLLHEQVEKDDDDDEGEDAKKLFNFRREYEGEEPQAEEALADARPAMVEVPLHDVNMPPEEFIEPLPLHGEAQSSAPAEVTDTEAEDEDPHRPLFSRTTPPPVRPASDHIVRPAAELATPIFEAPGVAVPAAPTAEAITLAAAEATVEAAEDAAEALAAIPTAPNNPNATPPTHNTLSPTANTPPNSPNAGGNTLPPVPPNNNGGGGGGNNFNNVPPNNHNYYYQQGNTPPNPNYGYANNGVNTITHVLEREHTIERGSGNLLAGIALIGLLIERSKRKGGDAKLEKKIKEQRKELEAQGDDLRRQNETIAKQRRELNTANLRTTELERHAAERQRVAEAFAPGKAVRAEQQPAAPVAERSAAVKPGEVAVEAEPDEQQPSGDNIRLNASVGTRMRKEAGTGREVVDTDFAYGQAYHQERRAETGAVASSSGTNAVSQTPEAAHAISGSAQLVAPIGIPLPGAFNPSLPAGMTNPALPADERISYGNMYNNEQYLLEPPEHRARNAATTVLLWFVVAALAFGIVSGIRLLF